MRNKNANKKLINQVMKQQSKWFAAALAVVCGLVVGNSAEAQEIGLSGISVIGQTGYDGWTTATFESGPSVGSAGTGGIEVQASSLGGFGGTYINLGGDATTISANSTMATLNFTINGDPSGFIWIGVPLDLNDGTPYGSYAGVYSGSGNPGNPPNAVWNGNTVSITYALSAGQISAIETGSDVVYGFNIGVDPASAPSSYDITFNSLTFSGAVVPEPSTMGLFGLSAAGLLALRRRK